MNKTLLAIACLLLGSSAHAIYMGTETDAFEHTGCLVFYNTDECGYATGTLIAPNWVLTAGHVSSEGTYFQSALGSSAIANAYNHFRPHVGQDIALFELVDPINASFYPVLSSVSIALGYVGTEVLTVGYGRVDDTNVSGKAYAYSKIIEYDIWYGGFEGVSIPTAPIVLTHGDSGGGTYIDFGDGYVLAGINSQVTNDGNQSVPYSSTGNLMVDVALFRGWLDDMTGNALSWGTVGYDYLAPVSVPEPGTLVLLTTGLLGVACVQRRRKAAALRCAQRRRASHLDRARPRLDLISSPST